MPKLPRTSAQAVIRTLEKMGFEKVRQKGSHVVLKRHVSGSIAGCVVPVHSEIAVGTLRGLLRQAGVSIEEFMKNY